mmetsp:Transcript_37348/g.67165  ORF Transcript_37348/g.67165 Transcript_37348/m.67165 type:complete len:313 (-) Transcript_37348:127-1065(-)
MHHHLQLLLLWALFFASVDSFKNKRLNPPERPSLVKDALQNNRPIYYFGFGSNMSRKKLENRGLNNTKIEIQSMGPAFVKDYRLSFNMIGFPPIEPGMGSLEPCDSSSRALLKYKEQECHGALVKLDPENYEKVMRSEGVGGDSSLGEEIVVLCRPYDSPDKPVEAIALRACSHLRLSFDPCPSARYMTLLREGAKELQLKECYQDFLAKHPVQRLSPWQRKQSTYNLIFTMGMSMKFKMRWISVLQSRLLFLVYAQPTAPRSVQVASDLVTAAILLPGSLCGYALHKSGKVPVQMTKFMQLFEEDDGKKKE